MQAQIAFLLTQLDKKVNHMTINLDRLTADVAAIKTVDASILALFAAFVVQIKDLRDQLAAAIAASDPAAQQAVQDKLDALATDLETESAALSGAVTANTPAAPVEPTPAPAS
jgi:Skp family chaperone for outer membrane proteins